MRKQSAIGEAQHEHFFRNQRVGQVFGLLQQAVELLPEPLLLAGHPIRGILRSRRRADDELVQQGLAALQRQWRWDTTRVGTRVDDLYRRGAPARHIALLEHRTQGILGDFHDLVMQLGNRVIGQATLQRPAHRKVFLHQLHPALATHSQAQPLSPDIQHGRPEEAETGPQLHLTRKELHGPAGAFGIDDSER